jgi:prolyl oligopeptidase
MTKLFNFPKRGCPFRRGDKYYHYYNTGLQNHFALYQLDSLDGEPKLFLVRDLLPSSHHALFPASDKFC